MYVLILPYLLLKMGFPEEEIVQYTIANSLVGTFFAALSANIVLYKQRKIYWSTVLGIGLFSTLVSLLLLEFFVNTSLYDIREFNIAVISLMLLIIYRTVKQNIRGGLSEEKNISLFSAATMGAGAGAVAALSGLGGGTVIIPMLNIGFKVDMIKAKSISLGVILISSLAATIFNFMKEPRIEYTNQSHGYIVYPLSLIISIGVILGSPLGVKISTKLSQKTISLIFVSFVVVVIIDKLLQLI